VEESPAAAWISLPWVGMWISLRRAADLLQTDLGINRESARIALNAGLAGEVVRAGGAHLVEDHSVRAVIERAHRPMGSEDSYDAARRAGAFVGRLGPRRATPEDDWRSWRGVDLAAPGEEQLLAAAGWWQVSIPTRVLLTVRAERGDLVPFIGVVAGLAVVGGEVAGVAGRRPGHDARWLRFDLTLPGSWFEELQGRRIGPRTGPPWFTWPDGAWSGRAGALDTIGT
jgi:hypothetical protein